ncbi:MAG TPA: Ig domain-containing protein, partial [Syntrophomonas sp.]|nr:Ig domain-containing protein [Syntrophomonas sp.]
TFSLATGSVLPNGLTLSETGLLSGTPTVVGSYPFTIEVRDSSATQQLASQSFTLLVRPQPIKFDLTPSKLANGSVPSFSFTMPAGITFQNPAQALVASNGAAPSPIIPLALTNTGTSYQAVGTAPINKAGEYILLIFEGVPVPGKMPVASGYFSVTPARVSATPGSLKTGYPSGQSIIIQDVPTANYWAANEINQVDIYKVTYPSPTTESETLVSTINSNVACTEADVVFTLPDNLSFGEYRVKLLTGSTVIAQASLMIFLPSINITPISLESNYPSNKTMTLQENTGEELWSTADQNLNLKMFSINMPAANVQKTFIADISPAALTLGTDAVSGADTIKFNPPVGLSPGEYLIQIFRDTNAIATCTFKVYTEDFNVNPEYILSGYPNDFTINFYEANENVWTTGEENLSAQISQTEFDPFNGEKITPVGGKISLAAATIEEWHITFPLPPCLDPGSYVIDLYRADSMIARGKLTIEVIQVGIEPNYVMDNYPSGQSITLSEPSELDLWAAADILSVDVIQIIAAAGGGGGSPAPITPLGITGTGDETKKLITTIPAESVTNDDKNISFTLPSGLLSGEYKFVILRAKGTDNEVVGETTFGIFPASVRLDMNPSRVTFGSPVPLTLYEPVTQSSLWNAEDALALQIQFYRHVPQTPWTPANFYPVASFVPGSISDDEISFPMPASVSQGQYLVVVKRGDKQIAYSNLQVNPTMIQIQANSGNIYAGYKGQLQLSLTNPNGSCPWNPNDGVWTRLLQQDKFNPGM